MIKKFSETLPDFEYYIKGPNPKLLIHSGTHGDEYEVIDFVRKAVEKYENLLPDFLFVPVVSPSAVRARKRFNVNGKDLNRVFFSDSTEIEVQENIKVLNNYKFDLMVSFHEDPDFLDYYIYDESKDERISNLVLKHNQKLKELGVGLLNGVDDPNDPHLGHMFVEGYAKFEHTEEEVHDGTATLWAIVESKASDCLVPEIPGKLDLSKKELVVDSFFKDILC